MTVQFPKRLVLAILHKKQLAFSAELSCYVFNLLTYGGCDVTCCVILGKKIAEDDIAECVGTQTFLISNITLLVWTMPHSGVIANE